ncbi:hypothetical protein QFC22_001057 [Naganishia vaughanmartiniae]|uniref:Uncharacterized protein n=1 Tax=Naganishia vaughanmartiniae TaxID=1424756 RepID=A0ACC2XK84_9TREE|nr:hypothetical protein QFC22_001057 [Naganishia vaughanmartiniae]
MHHVATQSLKKEIVEDSKADLLDVYQALVEAAKGREVECPPVTNKRVIAVDFDDVLAQSCVALLEAHNKHFGTNLTLDDFESYYPHRNRGWGSVEETNEKLHWFHKELNVLQWANPVSSVRDALLKLKSIGHPLHIVTARSEAEKAFVIQWLERHDLHDVWDGMHFIGAFQFVADARKSHANIESPQDNGGASDVDPSTLEQRLKDAFLESADKNSKVAVLRSINAALLIDDHVLNVDKAAQAGVQCLLFGDNYRWNKRRWGMQTPEDAMHFEERKLAGLPLPALDLELLPGVERAADWGAVVDWVVRWDKEAMRTDTVVLK